MQYVVLITIYTCISLFKNCNSTVSKTSHIIRSYPEVDMWAPVVLQEYGRLAPCMTSNVKYPYQDFLPRETTSKDQTDRKSLDHKWKNYYEGSKWYNKRNKYKTGKRAPQLLEYNCFCLHVNPIVGHLNYLLYD
jgi:hypothetical protein